MFNHKYLKYKTKYFNLTKFNQKGGVNPIKIEVIVNYATTGTNICNLDMISTNSINDLYEAIKDKAGDKIPELRNKSIVKLLSQNGQILEYSDNLQLETLLVPDQEKKIIVLVVLSDDLESRIDKEIAEITAEYKVLNRYASLFLARDVLDYILVLSDRQKESFIMITKKLLELLPEEKAKKIFLNYLLNPRVMTYSGEKPILFKSFGDDFNKFQAEMVTTYNLNL